MALKTVDTLPPSARSRKPKYPFSEKEVEEAVEALDSGQYPQVGPYDTERIARSAVQYLKRLVCEVSQYSPEEIGTKGWTDDKGKGFALLRVKSLATHSG